MTRAGNYYSRAGKEQVRNANTIVVTEKFYNVYGIERRGEVQTKTAYFDHK